MSVLKVFNECSKDWQNFARWNKLEMCEENKTKHEGSGWHKNVIIVLLEMGQNFNFLAWKGNFSAQIRSTCDNKSRKISVSYRIFEGDHLVFWWVQLPSCDTGKL